jgi:hypothetical protein
MGAAVRNIMPQRGSQLLAVVGEDLRVVCAARNGNVGHAVVKQVFRPQLGIDVDQYPVGGLSLAGMARHGVAVVEVRILHRIEFDLAASVHLYEAASEQSSHTGREGASAPPCTYPARKNKNKYYLSRIGSIWLLILKLKPCWIKQKSLRKSR